MSFRILSWFLILFACFYGIGSYPLLDNNEGMYASIARDMLTNHQFIVPHLLGLPYLEKPPMLYWLMAASMSLFGVNEWAVHLVPALAYFLTALTVQRFASRVTGSETTGLAAALMLATSLPLLVWGREVLCDMVMTCFFTNALLELYVWNATPLSPPPLRGRVRVEGISSHVLTSNVLSTSPHPALPRKGGGRSALYRFYAYLALAVLTKGLIALFLTGGIVLVFYLWERKPFSHTLKTLSPTGLLLFAVIATPWHIAASLQEPGFAWFYFINEHFMRFINRRVPHDYHTGAWWYYLPRILIYLIPWTLFLLIFTRKPRPSASPYPQAMRFLWSWFFVCLFFFSLAGSKANYYMLAGMPPLILLVTLHLKPYIDTGDRVARSLTSGGFALLLTALGIVRYFCNENSGELFATCQAVSWHYVIIAALYAAAAIALCWRIPQRWLAPLLASHILLLLPLLITGVTIAGERLSQKEVASYLQSSPGVAIFEEFEELSALGFYLEKPLLIVDSHSSDLLYGQNKLAHADISSPMFISLKEWATHQPAVPMVLLKHKLFVVLDSLYRLHIDLKHVCVRKRFDRVAIISMCDHG